MKVRKESSARQIRCLSVYKMRQHGVAEKKTRLGIIMLTFMILLCHQLSPQPGHSVLCSPHLQTGDNTVDNEVVAGWHK